MPSWINAYVIIGVGGFIAIIVIVIAVILLIKKLKGE